MAFGFGKLIEELKKDPKKIVFTEGTDPRILEASSRLLASTFLEPILVGDEKEIFEVASEVGFNIRGAKIVTPETYDRMDEMVDTLYELRRAQGMTKEEADKLCHQGNYFGTMLIKMGEADALPTRRRIPSDLRCRSSRLSRTSIWLLRALSWCVRELPVETQYSPWVTALSI